MTGGASEHTGGAGAGWDEGRRRRSSREEFLLPVKASALLHPNFAWHRPPPASLHLAGAPSRSPPGRRRPSPTPAPKHVRHSPRSGGGVPGMLIPAAVPRAIPARRRARAVHDARAFLPPPGQRSWQAMPPVTSSDARIYVTATMAFARPYAMGLCMQCMHLGAQ